MDPREHETQELEPTLDVETSPMMEPSSVLACEVPLSGTPSPKYWQAQTLSAALHREFEELQERGDMKGMRARFYVLARYYGRTISILRQALSRGREPLATAALRNLVTLHQPLHHMHEIAPTSVPFVLTLYRETRVRLVEDLIMEVLREAPAPLTPDKITDRVNELHLLADATMTTVSGYLNNLVGSGHVQREGEGYSSTVRAYSSTNLDQAGLQALLGPKIYREFENSGFQGLSSIANRIEDFKRFFERFTGCGSNMADMFIAAAKELLGPPSLAPDLSPWHHADLLGSLYPRPYQHDVYAILRGYGYQGKVIEAPTGSGKTLIGMMCIQDWLRTLSPGESILILVPTINYEQQWIGELCYKPIGLRMTPDEIFTGTPAALEAERKRTGFSPALIVMTYTALAQLGSPTGKGGFDSNSVEIFLQGNNVQYVILDEVHKVVEDLHSVSAGITRLLTAWLRDGSIRGLIGFSGTAAAYREKFMQLGLHLVFTLPASDLIAYGFVAPFSEYGVPFAYSDRENRVRNFLEQYKSLMREFTGLLGSGNLRSWFSEISMEERLAIGRNVLGMYAGRKDQDEALVKCYTEWEKGDELTLNELPLITVVQLAKNLSDESLVKNAVGELPRSEREKSLERFRELLLRVGKIREELKGLVYYPDISRRLNAKGFGISLNAEGICRLPSTVSSKSSLIEQVRDGIASSITGLYSTLKNLYLRVGEGRVDSIKAIIAAERSARKVTGVIVFDTGKRIRWESGTAVPGYAGVAGVFAQMIGDRRFTPMAVLSGEMYMPWTESRQLPAQIGQFIKKNIMLGELGEALFGLVTQGLALSEKQHAEFHSTFRNILAEYVDGLSHVGAARPWEFDRKVLRRFRKVVDEAGLEETAERLQARLSLKHRHIRRWVNTFFDYAIIFTRLLDARTAELQQPSGVLQKFFVVKMSGGERKQLMYDLTARIVDAEELPVNMIIVSSWARTGWNVIRPNVLIDATATRNVTAWQQLRGRTMRAMSTWNKDCYELVMSLLGTHVPATEESVQKLPVDAASIEEIQQTSHTDQKLDEKSKTLLLEVHEIAQKHRAYTRSETSETGDVLVKKIKNGKLNKFSQGEREQLVADLMLARNKVTHIHELVKAYGSAPQVRLDGTTNEWRRTDSISMKHAHEYSVNPVTGKYGSGEEHAPLMYSHDPRTNLPSQLQRHLTRELKGRDPLIIGGWISALAAGAGEELDLE
jgi:superfamily II DNA or RNA helicase